MRTQYRLEAQAKRYTQQHFDMDDRVMELIEQVGNQEDLEPGQFDIERMKAALAEPFHSIPAGLSSAEILKLLLARKSEGCTRCGGNHPLEDCHFPTVKDRLMVRVYPIPR